MSRKWIEINKLNTLVVARHGLSTDGVLTEKGIEDMYKLSNKLLDYLGRKVLTPGSAVITHSSAERASESAQVMSKVLSLTTLEKPSLGDKNGADFYGQERRLVEEFFALVGSYPCLIAITHEPLTAYVPVILHPMVQEPQPPIAVEAWARVFDQKGQPTTVTPDRVLRR